MSDKTAAVNAFWRKLYNLPDAEMVEAYEAALALALQYLTGAQIEAITEKIG